MLSFLFDDVDAEAIGRHAVRFSRPSVQLSGLGAKDLGEPSSSPWSFKMRSQRPLKIDSLPTLMTVLQLCGRHFRGMLPNPPYNTFIRPTVVPASKKVTFFPL